MDSGIRPVIARIVPFEENAIREVIDYVYSRHAQGKIVIRVK